MLERSAEMGVEAAYTVSLGDENFHVSKSDLQSRSRGLPFVGAFSHTRRRSDPESTSDDRENWTF